MCCMVRMARGLGALTGKMEWTRCEREDPLVIRGEVE